MSNLSICSELLVACWPALREVANTYQMPRTRTKFIWPPSTMTTDNTASRAGSDVPPASATSEPRAKRPRVASPLTSRGQAALTEEQSLLHDDPPRGDREEGAGSSQSQPAESNPLLAYLNEPMSAQIERYQNWRRKGSSCYPCLLGFPACLTFGFCSY